MISVFQVSVYIVRIRIVDENNVLCGDFWVSFFHLKHIACFYTDIYPKLFYYLARNA